MKRGLHNRGNYKMRKGIYQDKKTGKWYIHTTIKGKTCTIRGYNSKRECDVDYDRAVQEWSRKRGLHIENSMLLQDLCDLYYSYRQINMSQGTLHKDKSQQTKLLNSLGNIPVKIVFNFETVQFFCTNQKNNYRLLLYFKSLMTFAYNQQLIEKDYSSLIVFPKQCQKSHNELKVIPTSVKIAFFGTIKNNHDYFTMFKTFAYLGCRLSEFLGICYDCVDLMNKKIIIKRQLLTNGTLTNVLKTSTSYREIPLNEEIIKLLKGKSGENGERLFKTSHTTFKRILKKYLPNYSSHCFRHTRASELGAKCENLGDVIFCAKWLGHSPSMFLNTYCHNITNKIDKKFLD